MILDARRVLIANSKYGVKRLNDRWACEIMASSPQMKPAGVDLEGDRSFDVFRSAILSATAFRVEQRRPFLSIAQDERERWRMVGAIQARTERAYPQMDAHQPICVGVR